MRCAAPLLSDLSPGDHNLPLPGLDRTYEVGAGRVHKVATRGRERLMSELLGSW